MKTKKNMIKIRVIILALSIYGYGFNIFAQSTYEDTIHVCYKRSVYLFFDDTPKTDSEIFGMNIIKKENNLTFGVYDNVPDSSVVYISANGVDYTFHLLQADTLLKYEYYFNKNNLQRANINDTLIKVVEVVKVVEKTKRTRTNDSSKSGGFTSGGHGDSNNSRQINTSVELINEDGNQKQISAVIDNDNQKIIDGSIINIRINEPFIIQNNTNDRNKIVLGECKIINSRLYIDVRVEFDGYSVDYQVYGINQIKGITINKGSNKKSHVNVAQIQNGYKIILKLKNKTENEK